MNTYQIRVLTVFGLSFILTCVVGGGLLAGALMTEQYTLVVVIAAGLVALLAMLSYGLVTRLNRWEREARVRRYMRSTLATVQPGSLRGAGRPFQKRERNTPQTIARGS
jgi:hypothetical protein